MIQLKFLKCKPENIPPETGKTVAIIGGGPAGLGAAGYLLCKGHRITIYDMNPELGGLLIFGIPDYRIPKDRVREGIKELINTGRVKVHLNVVVGKDIDLEEIIESHDAVLIATGTWKTRPLNIPGIDNDGVYGGVEWITDYHKNKMGYPLFYHKEMPVILEPVTVLGGGFTAVDVAYITQIELGKKTRVVYRRTKYQAPIGPKEVEHIEKMGIEFMELLLPFEVVADKNGRVTRVKCHRTRLGPPDESGRPSFIVDTTQVVDIDTKTLMLAIGMLATPPFGKTQHNIKTEWDNRIVTDEKHRTTREKVFAAGDVKNGPTRIGPALKSGLDAAKYIDEYLAKGDWNF